MKYYFVIITLIFSLFDNCTNLVALPFWEVPALGSMFALSSKKQQAGHFVPSVNAFNNIRVRLI